MASLTLLTRVRLEHYKHSLSPEDDAERVTTTIKSITLEQKPSVCPELLFVSVNDEYTDSVQRVFTGYEKIKVVQTESVGGVYNKPYAVLMFNSNIEHVRVLNTTFINYLTESTPNLVESLLNTSLELFSVNYVPLGKVLMVTTNSELIPFVFTLPLFTSIDMYVSMRALFTVLKCMGTTTPNAIAIPVLSTLTTDELLLIREAYDDVVYS